jgi:hypothetical protein
MLFLSPLSEQMLSPVSEMLAIRHPDYWRYHCNFSYTEEFETVVHLYNAFFFFFSSFQQSQWLFFQNYGVRCAARPARTNAENNA